MPPILDKLEQAIRLAEQAGCVLAATVDETGTPRLTPVEELAAVGGSRVAIRAWIEASPLPGQAHGSRMALLIWHPDGQAFQLLGRAIRSQEAAVLDGLADIEQQTHFPQTERLILMQVDSVEDFHFATPHAHPPHV
jgi:hypothetical protein